MTRPQKISFNRNQSPALFIEMAIRLGALGLLLYWSLVLVRPFLSIVIWSVVLTVALYPAFEWTTLRLGGRRRLAAVLITVLSLLIVIGPATWLALGLIESLRMISERLDFSTLTVPPPSKSVKDWPVIGDTIYQFWDLASTNFRAALAKVMPQLKPLREQLASRWRGYRCWYYQIPCFYNCRWISFFAGTIARRCREKVCAQT